MKAVQIKRYLNNIETQIVDIPIPKISDNQVLIQVKAIAINPVDILNINGSIKLIQDYKKPITLGNEVAGIIKKIGNKVSNFSEGDSVYARLPIKSLGGFAEYVAVNSDAIALMPRDYSYAQAVTIPLAALTAYQAISEELQAKPTETVLITGGSGSFGQLAVPIAKEFGLRVIVTGNSRSKKKLLSMGVDQYIDYTQQDYWTILSDIDYVIDTLGKDEFNHELSVLKRGGKLVSLRLIPNKAFAIKHKLSIFKKLLFTVAGYKFDKAANKQNKEYRFLFVQENGRQLQRITELVEKYQIKPSIDDHRFCFEQINDALNYVNNAKLNGKVVIEL